MPYPALLARLALRGAAGGSYLALLQPFTFSFTLTRLAMLQHQTPVRRWKQWLALPVLGGLFLVGCQKNSEQAAKPVVNKEAREAHFIVNMKEAIRQDSLHNGGKGWKDESAIMHIDKEDNVTITHRTDSPPPPPQLVPGSQAASDEAAAGKVYAYVEQMPELTTGGGMSAIVQHIQDNLKYPAGPHQEGRVFASFTVKADGSVGDAKIIKGLAPAFDAAVLAAIQKLPRFVPGKQAGKAVAVSFTVPISIKN
ncbi:MAG: energy transducer TonB [Hymenobacter sp.]